MMMFMLNMSLLLSMMMLTMKHPLSMGMILLLQTINISLITGILSSFWFSYILTLIMVGGMLVMFIYMTSIASNEKFSKSMKTIVTISIMMMINTLYSLFSDHLFTEQFNQLTKMEMTKILMKFMYIPNSILLMTIMIYLLIAMIAVTKISKINAGPLRQMN